MAWSGSVTNVGGAYFCDRQVTRLRTGSGVGGKTSTVREIRGECPKRFLLLLYIHAERRRERESVREDMATRRVRAPPTLTLMRAGVNGGGEVFFSGSDKKAFRAWVWAQQSSPLEKLRLNAPIINHVTESSGILDILFSLSWAVRAKLAGCLFRDMVFLSRAVSDEANDLSLFSTTCSIRPDCSCGPCRNLVREVMGGNQNDRMDAR